MAAYALRRSVPSVFREGEDLLSSGCVRTGTAHGEKNCPVSKVLNAEITLDAKLI